MLRAPQGSFWGGLHGIMLMINHLWRLTKIELPKVLCWAMTFLGVTICWVFFRAENFHDAWCVLMAMTDVGNIILPTGHAHWVGFLQNFGVTFSSVPQASLKHLAPILGLTVLTAFVPNPILWMNKFRANVLWLVITILAGCTAFFHFAQVSDFLYFQF